MLTFAQQKMQRQGAVNSPLGLGNLVTKGLRPGPIAIPEWGETSLTMR